MANGGGNNGAMQGLHGGGLAANQMGNMGQPNMVYGQQGGMCNGPMAMQGVMQQTNQLDVKEYQFNKPMVKWDKWGGKAACKVGSSDNTRHRGHKLA